MEKSSVCQFVKKGIRDGDIPFFEHVYKEYYKKAVFYANQYLRDIELANDVAQDSFYTLWEKRHEVNPNLSIQSFILTIVKNKCLNILRKRLYERKYADKLSQQEEMANYLALCDQTADEYLLIEISDMVEELLNEMPEKMSTVFRMSRENELTYEEIASSLNISVKTVEYRMSKTLSLLRRKFKDYLPIILIMVKNLMGS